MPIKKVKKPEVTFRSELSHHLKPTTVYGLVIIAAFLIGFFLGALRPNYSQTFAAPIIDGEFQSQY